MPLAISKKTPDACIEGFLILAKTNYFFLRATFFVAFFLVAFFAAFFFLAILSPPRMISVSLI